MVHSPRRIEYRRVFCLGPFVAVVDCWHVDGRHYICCGHAVGGYGFDRQKWVGVLVALAIGRMFTVFVHARMWRRAELMTDVELIKLGYSGKAANEVCFC